MKKAANPRGRRRTSSLTRAEQIRAGKRAQRQRERRAGLMTIELRLPADNGARLRAAKNTRGFERAFNRFLEDQVLEIGQWPTLRELAWNRADRWIPAEEALALYERNWRFVEEDRLTPQEAELIDRLKHQFGKGMLNV